MLYIKYNKYKFAFIFKIFCILNFCIIIINTPSIKKYSNNLKIINNNDFSELKKSYQICHSPQNITNKNIAHFLITRFLLKFRRIVLFDENYIRNGIRLMKTYLFPSLESQLCKNFTWLLAVGDDANITHIKHLINFNNTFNYEIIYFKELKSFIKNKTKGIDILITTRIDYDDRIYYDAVNDVRKAINFKKPLLLYGYHTGAYYFESNGNYYEYNVIQAGKGALPVFLSLITLIKNVNDSFSVFEMGNHENIRETLIRNYKKYGLKNLLYEPAIFDSGTPKFVYVRQKYSDNYNYTKKIPYKYKNIDFNLSRFYGN